MELHVSQDSLIREMTADELQEEAQRLIGLLGREDICKTKMLSYQSQLLRVRAQYKQITSRELELNHQSKTFQNMTRTQEQIEAQIRKLELQKQAIDSAISILKGDKKYQEFDGADFGSLVAEHAEEWLHEESSYDIIDVPILNINI